MHWLAWKWGGIPLVTILSHLTGLPSAFIRRGPKEYGTSRYSEGISLAGKKFILVEDVVSSGGAIIGAAKMLRRDSIEVNTAVCVIDCETGGYEELSKNGINLISLFKQSDIDNSI